MTARRLSLAALGAASVARRRAIHAARGRHAASGSRGSVAFVRLGALVLGQFGRAGPARGAGLAETPDGTPGELARDPSFARDASDLVTLPA